MKILGIETSSVIFSLCLNEDGKTIREFSKRREVDGHGDAEIFKEARKMLELAGADNIGAIAVSIGPGMFTSLRVGLSLAKGIAFVNKTPVYAVNTLDTIGLEVSRPDLRVAAVVNAFRGEVYAAFYEGGKRVSDYLLMMPDSLMKMAGERAVIVGPGVDVIAGVRPGHSRIELRGDETYLPSAVKVVLTALERIRRRDFDDIEFLEPYYIKKTDAERNYAKGNAL
ncbi:tRNA (adenosine(37)-N6)-threonylcarbamoyltransferase complex dimerization subunit type 1 TsaB [candidate division WOR-3 bacterium]|nr:tRNA (adenosine(37)-N6)-threonylcarbamoyltransferase complex dimerization subunit type 1 TsaB [candidate division WOR-3 bacterium]